MEIKQGRHSHGQIIHGLIINFLTVFGFGVTFFFFSSSQGLDLCNFLSIFQDVFSFDNRAIILFNIRN